jgi:predicted ribosome quality control (RQC) complex YloA/Tae2 family protein
LEEKFKDKLLKDFGPILLGQFAQDKYLEYESFDKCVDEYFSQLDKQREQSKFSSKEDEIWKKMSRIREDQEKRISGLQRE